MNICDSGLAKPFITATKHVLSTMASIDPVPGQPFVKKNEIATGDVSAIVGFTGDREGSIALSFSKGCAAAILKSMLGDDIQDIIQDIKDSVGEITNMISGQARAGLSQMGISLQASTPTIIIGDNHLIRHMSKCAVVAIPFTTVHGDFTVEFALADHCRLPGRFSQHVITC